jgi:xylose dehydrogenase (NAD/NADP)
MTASLARCLRIGILSTARVAREFVKGVSLSDQVTVSAVASREADRAERFAREMGISRHFGSYEALLADSEIDAVYNSLPNSMHAEWSIQAVRAGKHVLCEKPLAATAGEARAMFKAARDCGVYLVEGYPYRSQPQTIRLQELLTEAAIGRVQFIQAGIGYTLEGADNPRLYPELAGGALMDAGSYPVSLVRMVANERPTRVYAAARWTGRGVDSTLSATMEFNGGLLAQISCSFATCYNRHALIAGSNGQVQTNYPNHPPAGQPSGVRLTRGTARDAVSETVEAPVLNGFLAEAEAFARMVRHGPTNWTGVSPEESIDIVSMLEAIKSSAHSGKPIELSA